MSAIKPCITVAIRADNPLRFNHRCMISELSLTLHKPKAV